MSLAEYFEKVEGVAKFLVHFKVEQTRRLAGD